MGLGGNVFEWEESSVNLINSSGSSDRGNRGGNWANDVGFLSSSTRLNYAPSLESFGIGFRVASVPTTAAPVPEPSMLVMTTLLVLGGCVGKRRIRK